MKISSSVSKTDIGAIGDVRGMGPAVAAMLPMSELEHTGIMRKLEQLDGRFQLRGSSEARH